MRYKKLLIFILIFFFAINTSYFWAGNLGIWTIPVFLLLGLLYLMFVVFLLRHIYYVVKEHFRDKQRVFTVIFSILVLLSILFYPTGLLDFEAFSGKDILIAQQEGAANCMTVLKLKENGEFIEKSFCFGINEIKGRYSIKNDTVYFEEVDFGRDDKKYYQYAVIKKSDVKNSEYIGNFVRYKNEADSVGNELLIVKYELNEGNCFIDSTKIPYNGIANDTYNPVEQKKQIVLVLPPYDMIANAGISPNIQKYLETEISKDTFLLVMKFPYKQLINIPYNNVFDKKYCEPILEKVKPDFIIMSKLDHVLRTGRMPDDQWNLRIRIYNTQTGVQVNSKIEIDNATDLVIRNTLTKNSAILTNEIITASNMHNHIE